MQGNELDDIPGTLMSTRERWHVGKEIPIAVMVTLLIQTGGIVWWAATVSGDLKQLVAQVRELKEERYTKNDAQRDQALVQQRFGEHDRRLASLEQERRSR